MLPENQLLFLTALSGCDQPNLKFPFLEIPYALRLQQWYKCSPLGVNSLRNMLRRMVKDSDLETDKKLVNHSTRKHLVQKLVDNDIPPNEIMQITGHKNIASINNYSGLSDKKQQQISGVLSGATATEAPKKHSVSIDETVSTSTCYLQGATPNLSPDIPSRSLFQNCKIGTVNVYQSGSGVPTEQQQLQLCSQRQKRRRILTIDSSDSSQSQ